MKLRLLVLGCVLVGPGRWAAAFPAMPQGCRRLATAIPGPGATIPANTPALFVSPPEYASGGSPSVEGMELQLRQPGLPDPVPFTIQSANEVDDIAGRWPLSSADRIVRIQRPLQVGEAILSFLDECGPVPLGPFVPRFRNERFAYRVGPAIPFPSHPGTARVVQARVSPGNGCGQRQYDIELALAPELAAFPLVSLTATLLPGGRGVGSIPVRDTPDRVRMMVLGACGFREAGDLEPGTHTLALAAQIVGGPRMEVVEVTVEVDCGADAGACPDPAPDGAVPKDAVADLTPLAPDTPTTDGPSLAADAGGPHGLAERGCQCRLGGRGEPLGWPLALGVWLVLRRRRRAHAT